MNRFKKIFTSSTKTANKKVITIYVILRLIVILNLMNEMIFIHRWDVIFTLVLTLVLFTIPQLTERLLKIEIPNLLEFIIILFIFSSTILGELGDFYSYFRLWDTMLHSINGFLAAGIGFSLVFLLNKNVKGINLNPLFLAIVTFCFSMTIGVMWEFFEYTVDQSMGMDMQKDHVVQKVNSATMANEHNTVHHIDNIEKTVIESRDASGNRVENVVNDGYLDVGIHDTMKDLFVNLLGAAAFSVLSYSYAKYDQKKYKFVKNFILKREDR
ncbi:MAG: hypothetical protein L0L63_11430 [Staphylococcus equorum]|uniref:hypothetical protein n=1 Tax=Staphylococcus TaxID=1279 RepID=UPI000853EDCB|nr:hypothetical protein [Staphylococcus equorum]MDG0822783.1 hypothetical protein [Staphylococcus equorum]MDG0837036.1 hypothetical protein [Staphylococcus equorum]MDK9871628.1 hypothetical protein [Staphylococcus equorum]MDK9877801.1 hypothetical protein [Staphylococcus equorum]MDN5828665.1 hypothetical protein [Staphylococcus equorum]